MANQERGELGVVVGGVSYTLRPTFDALCELEDLIGKPIDAVLNSVNEGRWSGLRAVVWCLLQDRHAATIVTLKDASAWIEACGGADRAIAIVNRVMGVNADDAPGAGGATPDPPSAQAGTGERSSSALVESA